MADNGNKRNIPIKLGDFSVIDTEFSSIRERFDSEMRKMEEEMAKFRSDLMNRESSFFETRHKCKCCYYYYFFYYATTYQTGSVDRINQPIAIVDDVTIGNQTNQAARPPAHLLLSLRLEGQPVARSVVRSRCGCRSTSSGRPNIDPALDGVTVASGIHIHTHTLTSSPVLAVDPTSNVKQLRVFASGCRSRSFVVDAIATSHHKDMPQQQQQQQYHENGRAAFRQCEIEMISRQAVDDVTVPLRSVPLMEFDPQIFSVFFAWGEA
ncbi:hypothetical protein AND_003520 [Anopheles darlingi]|uniref:Uncharacterized protein n=1 Tax=Anopheles darlingi TaxID=43151 RepID=W5JK23_ANODA|nr:hypothetical protein AND_003520 [Anopheles darlingi]